MPQAVQIHQLKEIVKNIREQLNSNASLNAPYNLESTGTLGTLNKEEIGET
jgi:hypothetical protein